LCFIVVRFNTNYCISLIMTGERGVPTVDGSVCRSGGTLWCWHESERNSVRASSSPAEYSYSKYFSIVYYCFFNRSHLFYLQLLCGLSWRGRVQGLEVLQDLLQLFPGDFLAPNLSSVVLAMLRLLPGLQYYILLMSGLCINCASWCLLFACRVHVDGKGGSFKNPEPRD
jgi:hypothetical protein